MDPNRDTPSDIAKLITAHGGLNPYGRPMWRLILCQNHLTKKRGIWHEFGDGTIEQVIRDPATGKFHHNPLHAIRVFEGVRETPMLGFKGWILERWFPAEFWVPWNPDQGPFPEEGEYFFKGGPWEQRPSTDDLLECISIWEREWAARPADLTTAYKLFIREEKEREAAEEAQSIADFEAFYRGEIKPIFNTISLGAQRVRDEAQAMLGRDSHLGAGQ